MRIINEVKLDFDDVLIVPKRSNMASRKSVELQKTYKFLNSQRTWTGFPLVAANMDVVGTFEMARVLANRNTLTCLHKHYSVNQLVDFFKNPIHRKFVFYTLGVRDNDLEKLDVFYHNLLLVSGTEHPVNICVDVANGYTKYFQDRVKSIRDKYPNSIIMAGNVVTPEMVSELLLSGGADIIKIGIGPGCFISGTKVLTETGLKSIEKIKIGEKVYTHTGTLKTVTHKLSRLENKRIMDINGIKCTPNHKFYVLHKKYKNIANEENIHKYAIWISAESLSDEYFLLKLTK